MAFVITEKEIKLIAGIYEKNLRILIEDVEKCKASINAFVWSESFKGPAAENMKAYMKEVHGTMLEHIVTISEILQERMQSYVKEIYHFERGVGFVLPEETISDFTEKVIDVTNKTVQYGKAINNELQSIASIISVASVADDSLSEETIGIRRRSEQLCRNINILETQYESYLIWPKAYIDCFKNNLSGAGVGSLGEITDYESGSMEKLPNSAVMAVLSKIEQRRDELTLKDGELDLTAQEKKSLMDIVAYMIPETKVELNGPKIEIPIAPGVTVYSMMKSNSGDLTPEDVRTAKERIKTAIKNQNGVQVASIIDVTVSDKKISAETEIGNKISFSGGPTQFSCKYQTEDGVSMEAVFLPGDIRDSFEERITVPLNKCEIETDYGISFYKNKAGMLQTEVATERVISVEEQKRLVKGLEKMQYWLNIYQTVKMVEGAAGLIAFTAPYALEMIPFIGTGVGSINWDSILEMLPALH